LKKRSSIGKILKTSLPAALDLASQPVMWLVEAVFIGRLSAAALGGVGFALQIILLTITLLLTFVMGAIILINRHLGSNNRWGANHILGQTLMSGFIFSILIGLIWYFGSPTLFRIIREQEIMNSGVKSLSGINSGIQY
jgi:Na+-driven multidrug efflux pump